MLLLLVVCWLRLVVVDCCLVSEVCFVLSDVVCCLLRDVLRCLLCVVCCLMLFVGSCLLVCCLLFVGCDMLFAAVRCESHVACVLSLVVIVRCVLCVGVC